jgi:small-conductance mechanosensitive channel
MPEVIDRAITPIATLIGVVAVLMALNWLLLRRRKDLRGGQRVPRQVAMAVLTLVGVITIVLTLPIAASSRNQIIGLIGLLVSAVIALSSTNIMANAMAGLLLRATRPFRVGDYISVGEHAGRVTERGLFDTEVQSEFRELIAIPNTFIITNPVTTLRSSGALISCNLSLGFDVHHARIEGLLIAAAEETGLDAPFVRIAEIGDFSVTYRVSGMLSDIDNLLTTRSNLHRNVLDTLHGNQVEIVSPNFMNQRVYAENREFIPKPVAVDEKPVDDKQDAVVFDKAMTAEAAEVARLELTQEIEALEAEAKQASGDEKSRITEILAAKRAELDAPDEE